jgi:hypothetical protein
MGVMAAAIKMSSSARHAVELAVEAKASLF